jgi:ankyrin repeat protein
MSFNEFSDFHIHNNCGNNDTIKLQEVDFTNYEEKKRLQKKITEMNIKLETNIENVLRCPLSSMLFGNSVIADDKVIYENQMINNYLKNYAYNKTSPITKIKISTNFYEVKLIDEIVDELIKLKPELKDDVYEIDYSYSANKISINKFINNFEFNKLTYYHNFLLNDNISNCSCGDCGSNFKNILFDKCTDLKIIDYVIKNSLDKNDFDSNGDTLVHTVCRKYDLHIIKFVIDHYDINLKNSNGDTPLHIVCQNNINIDIIKYFIDKGANFLSENNSRHNPIDLLHKAHISANNNNKKNIDKIISYIIQILINEPLKNFPHNQNLIHFLCRNYNNLNLYKKLKKEYDFDLVDNNGIRPIHILSELCPNDLDIYKYFIEEKRVNFKAEDNNGRIPIHILAAQCNNMTILEYFIEEKKVNLECVDINGWKPIHFICRYGTMETIEYFLCKGVDLISPIKRYKGSEKTYFPLNMVELNEKINSNERDELINYMIQLQQIQIQEESLCNDIEHNLNEKNNIDNMQQGSQSDENLILDSDDLYSTDSDKSKSVDTAINMVD